MASTVDVPAASPTATPNVANTSSSFDPLTTVILPGALLLTAIAAFTFMPIIQSTRILQWLQRMRYKYEVTFVLYMLSPTEKFILNSIVFLLLSWVLIAASLYLPEHIGTIAKRVVYYYSGSDAT